MPDLARLDLAIKCLLYLLRLVRRLRIGQEIAFGIGQDVISSGLSITSSLTHLDDGQANATSIYNLSVSDP